MQQMWGREWVGEYDVTQLYPVPIYVVNRDRPQQSLCAGLVDNCLWHIFKFLQELTSNADTVVFSNIIEIWQGSGGQ